MGIVDELRLLIKILKVGWIGRVGREGWVMLHLELLLFLVLLQLGQGYFVWNERFSSRCCIGLDEWGWRDGVCRGGGGRGRREGSEIGLLEVLLELELHVLLFPNKEVKEKEGSKIGRENEIKAQTKPNGKRGIKQRHKI